MNNESGSSGRPQGGKRLAIGLAVGLGVLIVVAVLTRVVRRNPAAPPAQRPDASVHEPATRRVADSPPSEPESDPILRAGREIYLARCVSCHGVAGKGDGPIAKALPAPAPRDLTAARWKHGDSPEAALTVVSQGVKDTAMSAWASMLGPEGTKSVTAYCLYLGKRPIPDAWRGR